jgi:autotransporter-associated beta strand protein
VDGDAADARALNLAAGSGTVTLTGAVGGTHALASVTITSAGDVSAADITADAIAQTSGTGTASFGGLLHATGAGGLSLTGNNFSITGGITVDAGPVTLSPSGSLTVSTGEVDLNGQELRVNGSGTSTISSVITGAGSALTKSGTGTLTLSGPGNTFGGAGSTVTVSQGVLSIAGDAVLGDAANSVTLNGGTLQATASFTTARTLVVGSSGGTVDATSGSTLTESGRLTGAGRLTKTDTGTLVLTSTVSDFTGKMVVSGGTLSVSSDANLGTAPATFVADAITLAGGTLQTTASFTLNSNRGLTLGTGGGTLSVATGTLSYAGTLSGGTGLAKSGSGDLLLQNDTVANTPGTLTVGQGRLLFTSQNALGVGAVQVSNGATLEYLGGAALTLANTVTFASGANVATLAGQLTLPASTVFPTTGTVQFNNDPQPTAAIVVSGNLSTTGTLTLQVGGGNPSVGPVTLSGVLSGPGGLTKSGPGTLILSNGNTYLGPTGINAGTLLLTGSLAGGMVTVAAGATLTGTGTVGGAVSVAGTVAPGVSGPGILNTGSVAFTGGSTFDVDLDGADVGTGFDQLNVTGTVDLTGATLHLTLGSGFVPTSHLVIINNDGSDPVLGTFTQGTTITVGGIPFTINYAGGDGNDVTLEVIQPTAVYVDDSWAGTAPGADPATDPVGNLVFGYTAFANVQQAINIVGNGGTVTIYDGSYSGAVNVFKPLGSIQVGANTANAVHTSLVNLGGAVTLRNDTTFNLTTADLTFDSTIDDITAGTDALTILGSRVLTLNGAVGGGTALARVNDSAATHLNGGVVVTTGDQVYGGAVTVGADTTLTASSVTFGGTVDDSGFNSHALTVSGAATFGGVVGGAAGVNELRSLHVTGASALNTTAVMTGGAQNYDGVATLGSDITLKGSNLTFGATLDSLDSTAHALTLNASGNVNLSGTVGGAHALAALTVTTAQDVTVGSTMTLTGDVTQSAGTGTTTFNGGSVGGALSVTTRAITLSSGTLTTVGAITLTALDAVSLNGGLNAGASTIAIAANHDGSGTQGFTQSAGGIQTTNTTASAVSITVNTLAGGSGNAALRSVQAGTTGTVTVNAFTGAIIDSNGTAANVTASAGTATLTGGAGIDADLAVGFVTATATDSNVSLRENGTVVVNGINAGTGTITLGAGIFQTAANEVIGGPTNASAVVLGATATLDLSPNNSTETVGSLSGLAGAAVKLGGGQLITGGNGASTTYGGSLSGTGGQLTKVGAGVFNLAATTSGTYTGATAVNGGTLAVNGVLTASDVTVASGATLAGSGTIVKSVTVSGTLAPGAVGFGSIGVLSSGSVTFQTGSTFAVDLIGSTPGTGYDQLNVSGTVNLGNATLLLSGGFTPTPGTVVTLVANDATDAVSATFNGLPEGTPVTAGAFSGLLTYAGGLDANDVTLTVTGPGSFTGTSASGNNFVLRKSLGNLQVLDNGRIVDARPLAAVTSYGVNGVDNAFDMLTLDLAFGGAFALPGGVAFQAGTGGTDLFKITGANLQYVATNYTTSTAGTVAYILASGQPSLVTLTGVATVDLSGTAIDRLNLGLTPGADQATVSDLGTGQVSSLVSTNGTFPTTYFKDASTWTAVSAGDGNDSLTLRRLAPSPGYFVLDGGAGQNSLGIDLTAAAGPDSVTLAQNYVSSGRLGGVIYTRSTGGALGGGVTVTLGNSGNQVSVLGIAAGAPTLLQTGAGNDNVVVGTDPTGAAGQLYTLAGTLTLDAGAGANALTISDAGRAADDAFVLTSHSVTAIDEGATINLRATGGNFSKGLTVLGTQGNDNFVFQGQVPSTPTTLLGEGGNDLFQFVVDPTSNYGAVFVDGGSGTDALSVFDAANAAVEHDIHSSPTSGLADLRYFGGSHSVINYQNVESQVTSVGQQDSYIRALYQEHVGAAISPTELAQWKNVLQTSGRAAVVQGIENLPQARQYLVTQWYARYLGSAPDGAAGGFVARLLTEQQETVLADFLAQASYYKRAGGTDAAFVNRLYLDLMHRAPTSDEFQATLVLVARVGRSNAVLSMQGTKAYQAVTVTDRYTALLYRQPTTAEVNYWISRGWTQNQITLTFETSDEFYLYGG